MSPLLPISNAFCLVVQLLSEDCERSREYRSWLSMSSSDAYRNEKVMGIAESSILNGKLLLKRQARSQGGGGCGGAMHPPQICKKVHFQPQSRPKIGFL